MVCHADNRTFRRQVFAAFDFHPVEDLQQDREECFWRTYRTLVLPSPTFSFIQSTTSSILILVVSR